MEKTTNLQKAREERKEGAKEAEVRNASHGTTATRPVGTWRRGNNVQLRSNVYTAARSATPQVIQAEAARRKSEVQCSR